MATWIWAYEAKVTPEDVAIVAEREQEPADKALEVVTNELMSYCAPLAPRLEGRWWEGGFWRVVFGGTLQAETEAAAEALIENNSFHGAPHGWSSSWDEVLHLVQLPETAEGAIR